MKYYKYNNIAQECNCYNVILKTNIIDYVAWEKICIILTRHLSIIRNNFKKQHDKQLNGNSNMYRV